MAKVDMDTEPGWLAAITKAKEEIEKENRKSTE